jgi:hypothetical protein
VWTGRELDDIRPIVDLHARWARLAPLESALDLFCSVVELSGAMGVSAQRVLPLLEELCRAAPDGFGKMQDVDRERLVAALESVATTCFYVAVHPHKCVTRTDAGMAELTASVRVLQLVYSVDEWQQATIGMGQSVEDDPDLPVPLDAPILHEAAELVDKQLMMGKIDYRSIKATLLESHSVEVFDSIKRTVQQLCAEAANQLDERCRQRAAEAGPADTRSGGSGGGATADPSTVSGVFQRAREIIEGSSKKLLTCVACPARACMPTTECAGQGEAGCVFR